ncbi:DUF4255 domain-containing protein [Streptomyces sodiiphilus]|uniref:DUF4255 domain-containing protein n=1 Tax=Streptomyces sodiiphilus TaxID=226217 RepID=A0ABN2PI25_9ACTN
MSNALALATVSESLRLLIAQNLAPEIDLAVDVETRRPYPEPPDDPTITVFLHQVTPSGALPGHDLPTRAPDGTLLRRPAAALDLHYLISCYGEESELVGQRLLGAVIRTLHEMPVLSRDLIRQAAARPQLAGSDLAESRQRIRFTPTPMDVEATSKLWGMLHQTPYALSVPYQASLVAIEGREGPVSGPPVTRRTVSAVPGTGPRLELLRSRPAGSGDGVPPAEGPVPAGHDLVIEGTGLRAGTVTARLGRLDVPLPPENVTDRRVVVPVPAELEAGRQQLRLLHGVAAGDPPRQRPALESNPLDLVRLPGIDGPVGVSGRSDNGGTLSATLAVRLDVPVGPGQRVFLLLDEAAPVEGRRPAGHRFDAPPPDAGEDPHLLRVPVRGVRPGRYLVRVNTDGVQSLLEQAEDGLFTGPAVDLPPASGPETAPGDDAPEDTAAADDAPAHRRGDHQGD